MDRAQPFEVVLADFCSLQLTSPLPQERALDRIAHLMSRAQSKINNIDSDAEYQALFADVQRQVLRYGISPTHIAYRQVNTMPGSAKGDGIDALQPISPSYTMDFATASPRGPQLGERMEHFSQFADECFDRFYEDEREPPDDIIHVSCTGYLSPSPAQKLVAQKRWRSTNVTHSYHMGCYGAFPPVHMASGYLAAAHCLFPKPKQRIDVVHTELSSVHVNFADHSPGNIVSLSLFGDGFIKYSIYSGDEIKRKPQKPGLRVLAAEVSLIDDSVSEMTWRPGAHNFEMYLSKKVPVLIRGAILPLLQNLCSQCGLDLDKQRQELIYAVHPGGPKILDHIAEKLGIERSQMRWSWDILHRYGNMSSATIPHIWQAILEDPEVPEGQKIASVAFGPGLTATSLLLEKIGGA